MERFTASGSPQQQRPCTFHSNSFIPFSPKPRHPREPHFTSNFRPLADHHLRRLPEDTELSVFDAQRYFNGGRRQTEGRRQNKALLRRQQAGMLSEPPAGPAALAAKTSPLSKQRWRPSSTCAWPLRGGCPCFRRKAVEVEEKCPAPRSPDHLDLHGIGSASLNKAGKAAGGGTCVSTAAAGGNGKGAPMENELGLELEKMAKFTLVPGSWIDERDLFLGPSVLLRDEVVQPFSDGRRTIAAPARSSSPPNEPTRYSLEVFQPAEESSTTPRGSVEFRRRAMKPLFPGDGGPRRSSTFPASPVVRVASVEDELASDSSSDLFEIEAFSTQTTPSRPSHTRGGFGDKAATTSLPTKVPAGWSSGRVNASSRQSPPGAGSAVRDKLRSCRCEEARLSGPGRQQKHARHERPHHTTRGASDGAGHVRASLAIPPSADASASRTNWARASGGPPLPAHSHVSASPAGTAGARAGV